MGSVAGDYEGQYFGGVEKFVLSADGKFVQEFSAGGKVLYTNQGTWRMDGRRVRLQNFIKAYWFTDKEFQEFRKPLEEFWATIPVAANTIVFSDDADYFVRKR